MNNELERLWKQPTFENLDRGVRLHRGDNGARLHALFAYLLFTVSDALPTKASPDALALETARKVVWAYRDEAEAAWQEQGFITQWSRDCLEGIAREMADKLARHPIVVNAVGRKLERRRDVVFADHSLTHGDALFVIKKCVSERMPDMFREILEDECVVSIKEDFIVTVNRSLHCLDELRLTKEYRRLIPLFMILTSLKRVHSVVLGG